MIFSTSLVGKGARLLIRINFDARAVVMPIFVGCVHLV